MIGWRDIYNVFQSMLPLYFSLTLGYGSVRWWRIFTPEQCVAINKLVAYFSFPFFTLNFALHVDPFSMNYRFIAADAISKLLILFAIAVWVKFRGEEGGSCYCWSITTFSLSTLTNALVVGVPLVHAMYGKWSEELVVQLSVVQAIVWLTVLLFLLELRKAWSALAEGGGDRMEQGRKEEEVSLRPSYGELMKVVWLKLAINPNTYASIVGITWAFIANRWHFDMPFIIEGSVLIMSKAGAGMAMFSMGLFMAQQEKIIACGPGLTIFALVLRFVAGPAAMAIGSIVVGLHGDILRVAIIQAAIPQSITSFIFAREYGLHAEVLSTAVIFGMLVALPILVAYYGIKGSAKRVLERPKKMSPKELYNVLNAVVPLYFSMLLAYSSIKHFKLFTADQCSGINRFVAIFAIPLLSFNFISRINPFHMHFLFIAADSLSKLLVLLLLLFWSHLFKNGSLDWSITLFSIATLPNTLVMGIPLLKSMYGDEQGDLMIQLVVMQSIVWYTVLLFLFEFRSARNSLMEKTSSNSVKEERGVSEEELVHVVVANSLAENEIQRSQFMTKVFSREDGIMEEHEKAQIGKLSVLLILRLVCHKLIRNLNFYASVLGISWALISSRWNVKKPLMMENSITILSNAGLGMAMFSLGLFMAMQPSIIACGKKLAAYGMIIRFIAGPAFMALSSVLLGIRGTTLKVSIVQAALPQGIVPFGYIWDDSVIASDNIVLYGIGLMNYFEGFGFHCVEITEEETEKSLALIRELMVSH
ncbi:hypothetical protein IEQ34_000800 [Dendrobium chrysotoxum]|uniref:Auxin efflux carrier component n=1 Tax=Dendrobium chrysotoxum TaxID=161865 RepID=A0AAV7HTZ7_DENCH|nr:hypothetical protein IEQ34_000800 [Dendrobium chrysotoxum]